MNFLHIDDDKCVNCGQCSEDCVTGAIAMGADGPMLASDHCISCGHCVAVCPVGALDNDHCPLENQVPSPGGSDPAPETLALILRSRRSIRCYQDKAVPRPLVEKLLDMARFAPTGGNTQGISFLALDDRKTLGRISEATIEWMEDEIAKGSEHARFMDNFSARYRKEGRNVILWGAPCLVIADADTARLLPNARENAIFSLFHAQLYATGLGLGTCWAGAVEGAVASGHPAMTEVLKPYGITKFVGALMVGYPKYQYHRFVDRDPLRLSWG